MQLFYLQETAKTILREQAFSYLTNPDDKLNNRWRLYTFIHEAMDTYHIQFNFYNTEDCEDLSMDLLGYKPGQVVPGPVLVVAVERYLEEQDGKDFNLDALKEAVLGDGYGYYTNTEDLT